MHRAKLEDDGRAAIGGGVELVELEAGAEGALQLPVRFVVVVVVPAGDLAQVVLFAAVGRGVAVCCYRSFRCCEHSGRRGRVGSGRVFLVCRMMPYPHAAATAVCKPASQPHNSPSGASTALTSVGEVDLVLTLLLMAASMLMLLLVRRLAPAAVRAGGRAVPSSEAARPSEGCA